MVRSARPILLAGAACSAALLATTLYGVSVAMVGGVINWPVLGFEVITAIAAVFALLTGLGKFGQGPSMAFACAAGAAVVGTGLSLVARQFPPMGVLTHPFFLLRFALASGLVLIGAGVAFQREPRALRPLLVGAACLGGSVLMGVALLASRSLMGIESVFARVGAVLLILVLAIASGGLLAAGVHLVVSAFERTRIPETDPAGSDNTRSGPGPSHGQTTKPA